MGSFYQPKTYFKGGGSYYQSKNYFKGGKRKATTRKASKKGGFYPSVMSGVVGSGNFLISAALHQGYKLLNNKTRKMKKSLRKKHK